MSRLSYVSLSPGLLDVYLTQSFDINILYVSQYHAELLLGKKLIKNHYHLSELGLDFIHVQSISQGSYTSSGY